MSELISEHPLMNKCRTYRFETIVISNPETSYSTEKSYVRTAEVYYLGKEKDHFKYQIVVVDFDFSNDDNAMGKMLKQISYLFDELEVTVDHDGDLVEIDNINFLRLRWTEISSQLLENHEGEVINSYFEQIGSLLEDKAQLIVFLKGYNMFGLLFNGLLQSFDTKRKRPSPDGYTEMMTPVQNGDKTILVISAEKLEETETDYFGGLLRYRGNTYEEGFIEVKTHNYHLKHSLLWIG
ncbi:hypothetical protein CLU96_3687 [Chryseobacterium sp. 52]|uniref:hypothetical protein n=1 Tax=Chryseobacterium sp. 52 TaxID=2035213 RepID=UPI000C1832E1|nr:hypothetical protein [Chryseobacterium sp. 52]PIF46649.1 hypothetical protein CLU96_3687 [Chryseobacterium sp. 52]